MGSLRRKKALLGLTLAAGAFALWTDHERWANETTVVSTRVVVVCYERNSPLGDEVAAQEKICRWSREACAAFTRRKLKSNLDRWTRDQAYLYRMQKLQPCPKEE